MTDEPHADPELSEPARVVDRFHARGQLFAPAFALELSTNTNPIPEPPESP